MKKNIFLHEKKFQNGLFRILPPMTTLSIRPPLASKKQLTGPVTTLFYTPFYSRKHIKTLFSCFFIFVMI